MKVVIDVRSPYQVLVFPYYKGHKGIEYVISNRNDADTGKVLQAGRLWCVYGLGRRYLPKGILRDMCVHNNIEN